MKATLGSVRASSCTRSASSPTSATSTIRGAVLGVEHDALLAPRRRSGSARRGASGMSMSSRTALAVTPSKAPSLKTLQFWKTSTKAAPLWSWARRNVSIMWLRSMSWVRATNAGLGAEGERQRVERVVEAAERRRLRDLADLAGGRVLALGEPVDLVVEQQDREVDVAAQRVDEVVAADRQRVAVAA